MIPREKRYFVFIVAFLSFFAAIGGCASKQYVPLKQTVKAPDKAKKSFTNVTPGALNQHRQAMMLFNQGDYAGAARHWREALQVGARDVDFQYEVNYNLGVTFLRMGKFILAEQHFRKAVGLDETQARAFAGLGSALAAQDRVSEAVVEYQKALAIEPTLSEAYSGIAGISIVNGQYDQAVDSMRAAFNSSSADSTIRQTLIQAHIALGEHEVAGTNLDAAEENFAIAASMDPANARPWYGLGHAILKRGYPGRAVPFYKKARELDPSFHPQAEDLLVVNGVKPDSTEAIRAETMAAYFAERGDFERAAEQYEMSLTREPTKLDTWLTLGDIYQNKLDRPRKVADCIHALWLLGVTDARAEKLSSSFGQDSPAIEDKGMLELAGAEAGLGYAADGISLKDTGKSFPVGSRVYRRALVKIPPGKHKLVYKLTSPAGQVVREDILELDNVAPERRLTSFDSLLVRGNWKQEWWIDEKLIGSLYFTLQ
jgi:Flp pilus assembly protein TadD